MMKVDAHHPAIYDYYRLPPPLVFLQSYILFYILYLTYIRTLTLQGLSSRFYQNFLKEIFPSFNGIKNLTSNIPVSTL